MPNWCGNTLSVTGPAEELKKFREYTKPLSAEKFIPIPQEFKDIENWENFSKCNTTDNQNGHLGCDFIIDPESRQYTTMSVGGVIVPLSDEEKEEFIIKYGASNSNDWACKNWGTKWDFCNCKVEELIDMVIYRFDTANGSPTPVIEKMAKMYPTLSFLLSYGGVEVQCDGSILFKEGYPLLWRYTGWMGDLYMDPGIMDFCDNFYKSLHNAFPDFVADPARVAKEQVNNTRE